MLRIESGRTTVPRRFRVPSQSVTGDTLVRLVGPAVATAVAKLPFRIRITMTRFCRPFTGQALSSILTLMRMVRPTVLGEGWKKNVPRGLEVPLPLSVNEPTSPESR